MTDYNAIRPLLLTEEDRKGAAKWNIIETLQEPPAAPPFDFGFGLPPFAIGGVSPATHLGGVIGGLVGGLFLSKLFGGVRPPTPAPKLPRRRKRS